MNSRTKLRRTLSIVLAAAMMVCLSLPITAQAAAGKPPFRISGSDNIKCNDSYAASESLYNGKSSYSNQGIWDPVKEIFDPGAGTSMVIWQNDQWELLYNGNQLQYYSTSTSNGLNPPIDGWVRAVGSTDTDFSLSYGPTFSIQSSALTVDEGAGTVDIPIRVSEDYGYLVTLYYTVTDGSAKSGSDFGASGALTFNGVSAATTYTLPISITDDTTDEPDETFTVTLTSAQGEAAAGVGGNPCTVTITDNDPQPTAGFASSAISAGEDVGTLSIPVHLSNPSSVATTVQYTTADGTAVSGTDYQTTSGTLTIPAGSKSANIQIPITDNTVYGGEKNFQVTLSSPVGLTLGTASATITLTDNETMPTMGFSSADIAVSEGNATVTLPVSLSGPSASPVTARYYTADGTATAGFDYTGTANGTVTIPAGSTTADITIPLLGDPAYEGDETFTVTLTDIAGASEGTILTETVTIQEDDPAPALNFSAATASVSEDTGTVTLTATLASASARAVTVDYATADGTAVDGQDYTAQSGTLTIPAGETSTTITIPITKDTLHEYDEQFAVSLSNAANATLGAINTVTVTVTDDDAMPTVAFRSSAVTVSESTDAVAVYFDLSAVSGTPVTVDYATSDGTAKAGEDYTAKSGTLTIPAGMTSAQISISLTGDTKNEADEAFTVTLSGVVEAELGTPSFVIVTLTDDDAPALTPRAPTLAATDEDTTSTAVAVSDLLQGYADENVGIAVIAATGNGAWQYSMDGTTWTPIGTVSVTSALLLSSTAQIRYVPDGIRGETVSFTFRAWDGTVGTASTNGTQQTINTSVYGGASAFSAAADTATISVSDSNDPPTDIILSSDRMLAVDTGADAVVGTLGVNDIDASGPYTYSLTTGTGDGNNDSFSIDGDRLQTRGVLAEGSYSIRITVMDGSTSYEKAFVVTVSNLQGVTLTPDTTDNSVDNDLEITFATDATFAGKITSIGFGGYTLLASQYTIENDKITLHPSGDTNNALRTPETENVTIVAAGYDDSVVSQTITAGAVSSLEITTQPVPGTETGDLFAAQPVIVLKDQYGNLCADGLSAAASVVAAAAADTGTWDIGGTLTKAAVNGVATFDDLTCTLVTRGSGKLHFATDGISVDSNVFSIPEKNSSLSPAAAGFDKYTTSAGYHDIEVTVALNGNTLVSIKNGGTTLAEGTNYTSVGNVYSIKKEYLASLPTGSANLTFEFTLGADQVLTVTVSDSTPSRGGGNSTSTQPFVVSVPLTSNTGTASLPVSVSGNTATVKATDAQLKETVSTAKAGIVTIDVSSLKVAEVVIPSSIVAVTEGASETVGLAVALSNGTVTLDNAALTAIADKGDIRLSVETVNNSALTASQKEVLGSQAETAFVVDVNLYADGKKTSTFGNGTISVSVPYTLKSGENADTITVWFINDDGTIEPKNGVYNTAVGCVEFTTDHLSQYLIVSFPFVDVSENAWYYGSVAYAYNNGLFAGTSATSFSPDKAMTRQMIWIVLARMDGQTPANMDEARIWAMENGVSDGTNPTDIITREQMAVTLYRYAQYKGYDTTQGGMAIREFADYDSISEYARPALAWTVAAKLMQGAGNNIMPSDSATRAQAATILQLFFQNIVE